LERIYEFAIETGDRVEEVECGMVSHTGTGDLVWLREVLHDVNFLYLL
jgi:hypothetical protein